MALDRQVLVPLIKGQGIKVTDLITTDKGHITTVISHIISKLRKKVDLEATSN
jgi:hypothetical protein